MTYENYGVGAPVSGKYKRAFSTYYDENEMTVKAGKELCNGRPYKLTFTLKPYEAVILEIPFHESTEEELKKEKAEKSRVQRAHKAAKSDLSHVPQTEVSAELAAKKPAAKKATAKKTTAKK